MVRSGWNPDEFDVDDKPYYYNGQFGGRDKFKEANLLRDHPDWLLPVYEQWDTYSCTANATAAAIRFLALKHKKSGDTKDASQYDPSRLFLYYNARAVQKMDGVKDPQWPKRVIDSDTDVPKEGGSKIRDCMKSINLFGIAPESTWPFEKNLDAAKIQEIEATRNSKQSVAGMYNATICKINDRPTDFAYETASETHATEYLRLDPDYFDDPWLLEKEKTAVSTLTLLHLRQCLVEGYPVVFGINWYEKTYDDNFERINDEWYLKKPPVRTSVKDSNQMDKIDPKTGEVQYVSRPTYDGHTVLAVAFEDSNKRVLIRSSWNDEKQWTNADMTYNRHFWVHYDTIEDYDATSDFWMIRFVKHEATVPGHPTLRKSTPLKIEAPFTALRPSYSAHTRFGTASTIAVVQKLGRGTHVFYAGEHGTVEHTWTTDGAIWAYSRVAEKDSIAGNSALATVVNPAKQIEVFWITPLGRVGAAFSTNLGGTDWHVYHPFQDSGDIAIGGLSVLVVKNVHIGLCCATQNGRVLFAERTKGIGEDAHWTVNDIAPEASASTDKDSPSSITSASRGPDHAEFWWVGPKGSIEGCCWLNGWAQWGHYTLAPQGSAALRSRITAVTDGPSMRVYYITPNGSIREHSYYKEWQPAKFIAGPSTPKINGTSKRTATQERYADLGARVDSGISVTSSSTGMGPFDVAWVSGDNSVITWNESENDKHPRRVALSGQATAGTPVAAFRSSLSGRLYISWMCAEDNDPLVLAASTV